MSRIFTISGLILVAFSPFLLFATWAMTWKTKSFKRILAAHTAVLLSYAVFVLKFSHVVTGHDEYGLGQIGMALTLIVAHIFVGFAHALYLMYKTRELAKQPGKTSELT
jgi:hypothetical protein